MRKMIGEMDIIVAQLSSELKFIKNGMILAFFVNLKASQFLISMLLPHLSTAGHVNVKFIEIQVLIFQH